MIIVMTNTERLIASIERCKTLGIKEFVFMVGRYTGNGPSVINALRRRGYKVQKTGAPGTYSVDVQ